MRHPRIIIAGIGLAAVAAVGGVIGATATPGLAPIATSRAQGGTVPAVPTSGLGY